LSYLANTQTDRQTDKQSLAKNITSLAKVNIILDMSNQHADLQFKKAKIRVRGWH